MKEVANYTRLVAEYSDLLLHTGASWTSQMEARTEELGKEIAKMKERLKK